MRDNGWTVEVFGVEEEQVIVVPKQVRLSTRACLAQLTVRLYVVHTWLHYPRMSGERKPSQSTVWVRYFR